jgi:hypothetical protein
MTQCNTVDFPLPDVDSPQVEQTVTFAQAFATTPNVVCSLHDCGPHVRTAYLSCMAYGVTTTGFQAIIKRTDTTPVPRPGIIVTLHWIATGQT